MLHMLETSVRACLDDAVRSRLDFYEHREKGDMDQARPIFTESQGYL